MKTVNVWCCIELRILFQVKGEELWQIVNVDRDIDKSVEIDKRERLEEREREREAAIAPLFAMCESSGQSLNSEWTVH